MRAFGCLLALCFWIASAAGQQTAWKPAQPVELISSTGVGGAHLRGGTARVIAVSAPQRLGDSLGGETKRYLTAEYKAMFGVLTDLGLAKQ